MIRYSIYWLYYVLLFTEEFYLLIISLLILWLIPCNYSLIKLRYFNAPSKLAKMNVYFTMILQFVTSTLFIPIIGLFVDSIGKRTKLLVVAATLGVITYCLFILTYPTLPLILLGISYSLFATVIWPSLALVVNKEIIVIAIYLYF